MPNHLRICDASAISCCTISKPENEMPCLTQWGIQPLVALLLDGFLYVSETTVAVYHYFEARRRLLVWTSADNILSSLQRVAVDLTKAPL